MFYNKNIKFLLPGKKFGTRICRVPNIRRIEVPDSVDSSVCRGTNYFFLVADKK